MPEDRPRPRPSTERSFDAGPISSMRAWRSPKCSRSGANVSDATVELRTAQEARTAGRADLAAAIDGRLEALESGVEMPAAAPHPGATGP
jgi:hypothetical protein